MFDDQDALFSLASKDQGLLEEKGSTRGKSSKC